MGPPIPPAASHIGHHVGPATAKVHLGVYLDYCCPFSAKSYRMLFGQVVPHLGDRIRVSFYHQVQSWHPQSAYMHEAALAVAKVGGEEAFWKFSALLMDEQEQFFDVNTYDLSRRQIYEKLAQMAADVGVDKGAVMDALALTKELLDAGQKNPGNAVTQDMKWEIKSSRQLSMHVSPTTTLNGLVCDTSSSWTLSQWRELLEPVLLA